MDDDIQYVYVQERGSNVLPDSLHDGVHFLSHLWATARARLIGKSIQPDGFFNLSKPLESSRRLMDVNVNLYNYSDIDVVNEEKTITCC